MSLLLPPSNHPARELFEVSDLATMCAPSNRQHLPTLPQAKRAAAATFANAGGAIRAITSVVLHADGSVRLQQFGPRGGRVQKWNFGVLA